MKTLKSKQFLLLPILALLGLGLSTDCFGATSTREFFNTTQEQEDKDGSIFPGGSCSSCTKDGSMFPGGRCERCKTPCKDCQSKPKPKKRRSFIQNYITIQEDEIYRTVHRECKDFAPIQLEWVDFRIQRGRQFSPYSNKLGNYRFRIFGCRRETKNAILNQGRIMQKDMQFIRIFDDAVGDCYPIVKIPNDVCLEGNNEPTPEYILTAEITDYFMNICDGYDWDESKKENLRTGSAEMTVTWRLMDLSKTNVLWKGTSVGYSEVNEGEYNGELILIERAFADAVDNLRNLPGFENQLARRVTPEELKEQRDSLIAMERIENPIKCQYQQEIKQAELEKKQLGQTDCLQSTCPVCPQCPSCLQIQEQLQQQQAGEQITLCENPAVLAEQPLQIQIEDPAQIQTVVQTQPQYQPEQLMLCTDGTAVSQIGGLCSDGTFVEDGGVCPDGSIVQQAGGLCSDGSVVIIEEEALPTEVETVQIVEEPLEVEIATAEIEENGGSTSSGSGIIQTGVNAIAAEAAISESGDSISSGTNVAVLEENWVDIPLDEEAPQESIDNRNTTEESFATSKNSLCIVSREPYDSLTPENLYTIRASIMEITNAKGKKGAGLIISDQFVLTSADLVTKDVNRYDLKTINGVHYTGTVFRINPNKNTALLLLDEKTLYTPLSLNLDLPEINKDTYMTLGLLDFESGEGYLDNNGKVSGYRYSEEKGAEIIVDTFVQTVTTGGALIDSHGTITGLSNSGKKLEDGPDLFIPIETALKSVGLEICGKAFGPEKEIPQITRPISNAIETNTGDKSPESMNKKERK
ncbi:MAG: hypothetical protein J6A33_02480 [Alphaproteobacteria bacterium]|nr:hypothetical protein [Alphaproteobacteria bacterium]